MSNSSYDSIHEFKKSSHVITSRATCAATVAAIVRPKHCFFVRSPDPGWPDWAIFFVYYEQFCENYRSSPHLLFYSFQKHRYLCTNFYFKNGLGYILGDFGRQTHLVTLSTSDGECVRVCAGGSGQKKGSISSTIRVVNVPWLSSKVQRLLEKWKKGLGSNSIKLSPL
jgi:hypothetical protein